MLPTYDAKAGPLKPIDRCIIFAVWLITQAALLMAFGINDGKDAQIYISRAIGISEGHWNVGWNDLFYSGYIAIHILLRMAGLSPKSMYIVQLLLSGVGLHYFIRTLSLWTRERRALVIAGVLYASCFATQRWVSILWTDSVFFNLLVISLYYFLAEQTDNFALRVTGGRTQQQSSGQWRSLLFLFLLPLFRPVGALFAVLACIYWLLSSPRRNAWKLLTVSGYLVLLGGWVYLALTASEGYFYPLHNLQANVICGYPSGLLRYQRVPYREGMSVAGYLFANPAMALRLFALRFVQIFSMTRPYYSVFHNLIATVQSIVYYFLALVGFAGLVAEKNKLAWFLAAGIGIFCVPSIVFCVDWSGRFSLPVFCFILLLMGAGVTFVYRWTTGRKKAKKTRG